jgi:hypothetical protein
LGVRSTSARLRRLLLVEERVYGDALAGDGM